MRSADKPDGFWPTEHRCRDGNTIAFNTLWVARYVAEVLGQGDSIENPHTSYMWPFLQPWCSEGHNDVVFSPCVLCGKFRKPTMLRCWNWTPETLVALCTKRGE